MKPVYNISRWLIPGVIVATSVARGTCDERAAETPAAVRVLEEFEIAKDGDRIILPVAIAGKEYPFVLDMACDEVEVDARLHALLGKPLDAGQAVGETKTPRYTAVDMRIGKLTFNAKKPLKVVDLARAHEQFGHDAYGYVGRAFLRGRVIQVDFDVGKLRVLAAAPDLISLPSGYKLVPMHRQLGWFPCVRGRFEGLGNTMFFLNTNQSFSVAVRTEIMDMLAEKRLIANLQNFRVFEDNEERLSRSGEVDGFSTNGRTRETVDVTESFINMEMIGLSYLARYVATFDFTTNLLYLYPGTRYNEPDRKDFSGIGVVFREGKYVVNGVAEHGVANAAGVRPGDVLEEIYGANIKRFSLFEIRRFLSGDAPVTMAVTRDKQILKVHLARRENALNASRTGPNAPD